MNSRSRIAAITVIAGALIAAYVVSTRKEAPKDADQHTSNSAPTTSASTVPPKDSAPSLTVVDAAMGPDGVIRAGWGSALGQVGHSLMSEGNPEGPMSFVRAGDELLVLDQVNSRVVRYDKNGRPIGTFDATHTTQDINVAKDGSVVMLDRLVDKRVRILDKNGKPKGELSLPSDMKETGLVTGVFTDDKNVYVEKSHGALVGLGTLDGQPLSEKTILTGRPSKSGNLLVSAALVANKLTVNAFDRAANKLRYTRVIPFKIVREIVLVDTDAKDVVYVGASEEEKVNIACLDPGDGHVLGRLSLELSMVPEETFKQYSVADDGTITSSFMTEAGAEYHTEKCP
jgi:hypothetical protein